MSLLSAWLASPWSERIGWTLVHSVWQIAVVTVAFGVAAFVLRRASAGTRYLLGCLALVMMVAWPAATFVALPLPTRVADAPRPTPEVVVPSELAPAADGTSSRNPRPLAKFDSPQVLTPWSPARAQTWSKLRAAFDERIERWTTSLPWLTACWLTGVCVLAVRPLGGLWAVRRLKSRGLAPLSTEVRQLAGRLLVSMRIDAAVQFAESAIVEVPTVVGYLRPMILLPATAITGLSREQLEMILAHELAHIRRHDYLVNLVQTAIEALLFFHPGMWWVSARIRQERENCCDDLATACCGSREQLARALYTLASRRSAATPALAATGGALVQRIQRLLQGNVHAREERPREWLAGLVTLALIVCLLPLGSLTARSMAAADASSEATATLDPGDAADTRVDRSAGDKDQPTESKLVEIDPSKPWVAVGRVTDADGNPMAGVQMKAFSGIGSLYSTGTSTTDEHGRYRLAFGPGLGVEHNSTVLQAATIYASKPGYAEQNLCRQGDYVGGHLMPTNVDLQRLGKKPSDVFLPGETKSIDFVLARAAVLEGEFIETSRDRSVDEQKIYLTGDELPPSCSVLVEVVTDRNGRFRLEDVPLGRKWRIGYRLPNTWVEIETDPFQFESPGVHRAKLFLDSEREGGAAKMSLRYGDLEIPTATETDKQAAQKPNPLDKLDGEGFSQLHRAASGGHVDKVRELLDAGANVDVQQRTYHGTPLQYAASNGHGATVQLLLDRGATVDARDTRGRTPLAWAAQNGHGDVVRRLVEAGAAVNSRANGGWTPLHYAVDRGHVETAQYLIDHAADLHARNSQRKTPFELNPGLSLRVPWRALETPVQPLDYVPGSASSRSPNDPPSMTPAKATADAPQRFGGQLMASVQGQPIFWRDLAPSPEWLAQREAYKKEHGHTLDYETPEAYAARRLREAIWKRLVDEYRKQHRLKPTEDEIEEFLFHYRQARAKNDQAGLIQQTAEEERFFAAWHVERWKLQQSLYKRYGGRAIFQQVGPEAIDAMRDWLKEKEAGGQLVIRDAQLRDQFWEPYLRENPGVFITDPERAFKYPWSSFE